MVGLIERRPNAFTLPRLQGGSKLFTPYDRKIKDPFKAQQSDRMVYRTGGQIYPGRKRFSPIVILFMGRRDAGKSLAMTAMAKVAQNRYRSFGLKNYRIFANYYLKFAMPPYGYWHPKMIDALLEFPPWGKNGTVCVDEIQTVAPSRRAMSGRNLGVSTYLSMLRKQRLEIYFTTQFPQVLDQQLLMQVDLFIEASKAQDGRVVWLYIHDWWGQFTGNWERKRWPPRQWEADDSFPLLNTDLVWGEYDTDEVIAPMFSPAHVREALMGLEDEGETMDYKDQLDVANSEDYEPPPPLSYQDQLLVRDTEFDFRWANALRRKSGLEFQNIGPMKEELTALGFEVYRHNNAWYAKRVAE